MFWRFQRIIIGDSSRQYVLTFFVCLFYRNEIIANKVHTGVWTKNGDVWADVHCKFLLLWIRYFVPSLWLQKNVFRNNCFCKVKDFVGVRKSCHLVVIHNNNPVLKIFVLKRDLSNTKMFIQIEWVNIEFLKKLRV